MTLLNNYSRGAEWRQWDLHIHTPASFHWNGKRFNSDLNSVENISLVDEMIEALNNSEPAVFALMDYWTFDGWFSLKRRLAQSGAPKLLKRVFPGIELRLMAPMPGRLNAHVLFSDEVDDQMLRDFKGKLHVELINRPLSDDSLIALARMVNDDKLKHHNFKKIEVDGDDDVALRAGSTIAELSCESYRAAILSVPNGGAIGFMPFGTNDGLDSLRWQEHYAFCLGLFQSSPIFEERDLDRRAAFVGEQTEKNKKWIENFQKALGGIPRLAVSGSDAHSFKGIPGNNDRRGYGDFPSGKVTWIKADPTFEGLKQAIMEPAKRSFIGEIPPKLFEVKANKTYFIDSIEINKTNKMYNSGVWFDGVRLPLNPDLVAIIGNKGSGKSALADVIALLGNSSQKNHFSFLKKDRFRGKSGDPAKHFAGTLSWLDGGTKTYSLNDDPSSDGVELVRYIPQGYFEDLCNEHISGKLGVFEIELRKVIFSHAGEDIRLGALDFNQLIDAQESSFRSRLSELKKELRSLNQVIVGCEEQLQPEVVKSLIELRKLKERQVAEHQNIKPNEIPKPTDQLSQEQKSAAEELDLLAAKIKKIDDARIIATNNGLKLAAKTKSIQNIREHVRILERAFVQFSSQIENDLTILELKVDDLVALSFMDEPLRNISSQILLDHGSLKKDEADNSANRKSFIDRQAELKVSLNLPQLEFQRNQKIIKEWVEKLAELTGSPDAPESLEGLTARILQIEALPKSYGIYQKNRLDLVSEIFEVLDEQRKARENLYRPVQELIQQNHLICEKYKIQFQASLGGSVEPLSGTLFSLIKQNSGEFRGGDDESYGVIRKLAEQFNFNRRDDVLAFVTKLNEKIVFAANGGKAGFGIDSILRKDKVATDVYDLIFGLEFLEPRYSLLFQETLIEQLSPGQRGALLLIFYLLVDKGRNPIILDQPEENLDNETVVGLLVPVLSQAKKRRQIIMVTHNPNLAVVCDAEQIILAAFDRRGDSKITYISGAIENPKINQCVVDVLEGTKPAFNNRRVKYH